MVAPSAPITQTVPSAPTPMSVAAPEIRDQVGACAHVAAHAARKTTTHKSFLTISSLPLRRPDETSGSLHRAAVALHTPPGSPEMVGRQRNYSSSSIRFGQSFP